MEYVVSLFNTFYNINITIKKLEIIFNIYKKKLKNNTKVHVNEILSNPFISISLTKVFLNPKIQMEKSHLIVEPIVTQKGERKYFDWAFYDNNISELLEVCLNLTYYTKTFKFINMFPNIKRKIPQIMNHIIYIYKHKNIS